MGTLGEGTRANKRKKGTEVRARGGRQRRESVAAKQNTAIWH